MFTNLGNPIGVAPGKSGIGPVYSSWTGVFSTPNATGNILVGSAIIGQWQSTMIAAAVPEPSTFALLGLGTTSLIAYRRRRRTQLVWPSVTRVVAWSNGCSRDGLLRQVLSAGKQILRNANLVCNRYQNVGRELWLTCTQVAASREVLPGRQDLPKSATTPDRTMEPIQH